MSTGKTYSTKYLLDSNNNRGAEGQVLSTTSTGIDWVDANTVPGTGLWLANGNDIYNSNSGNVGIGRTDPDEKLDVDGVIVSRTSSFPTFKVQGSDVNYQGRMRWDTNNNVLEFLTRHAGTYYSDTLVLKEGKVGIGTNSPGYKLEVAGNITAKNNADVFVNSIVSSGSTTGRSFIKNVGDTGSVLVSAVYGSATTGTLFGISATRAASIVTTSDTSVHPTSLIIGTFTGIPLYLGTNNSSRITILANGNVGIGTTAPLTSLDVVGGNTDSVIDTLTLRNESTGDSAGTGINFIVDGVNDIVTAAIYGQRTGSAYHQGSLQFKTRDNSGGGLLERMRIDSSGDVQLQTVGAKLRFQNSAGPAPYIKNSGENSSTAPYGQNLEFYTGGSKRLTIDTSGNATFGGDVLVEDNLYLTDAGTVRGKIQLNSSDRDDLDIKAVSLGSNMKFFTADAERMRITSGGNVGIGTTNPSFQLSIENHATTTSTATMELDGKRTNGTDGPVGEMIFSNNGDTFATVAGFRDVADNKGSLQFQTQDSTFATRMTISSEGNVGIGTASPDKMLQVSNGTQTFSINPHSTGIDLHSTGDMAPHYQTSFTLYTGAIGSGSAKVTVDSGGNVGIGTTNPNVPLEVHGADITTRANTTAQSVLRLVRDVTDSNYTSTKDSAVDFMLSRQQTVNNNLPYTRLDIRLAGTTDSSTPSLDVMSLLHNGNVGIGTTDPIYKLDVVSTSAAVLSLTGVGKPVMRLRVGTSTIATIQAQENISFDISAHGTSSLNLQTGSTSTPRLTILTGGNVGIGNTNPEAALDIYNPYDVTANPNSTGIRLRRVAGGSQSFLLGMGVAGISNNYFAIRDITNSAYRIVITDGGNVGIGTTSPAYTLDVQGPDTDNAIIARFYSSEGSRGDFIIRNGSGIAPTTYIGTGGGSEELSIGTEDTNAIYIDDQQRVGIGTTSPGSLLEIEGATNSSTSNLLRLSRASQGSSPEKVAGFYSGTSGEKGYITVNNFGTAYNTSSDYRLKENIKPIDNSVERLMSLKPCNFNFISEDEDKVVMDGFIAHEAKEVVPEAVTGAKDAVDKEGKPAYQGIDQSKLVPLLTAALQEALQRIEILEQKINN